MSKFKNTENKRIIIMGGVGGSKSIERAFNRDRDSLADKDLKKNELVLLSFAPHPFFT